MPVEQGRTPVEYGVYSESSVEIWRGIARRQEIRDSVYWAELAGFLKPGSVLELGSAIGQVSEFLNRRGFRAVGSDFFGFFVEDMKRRGLEAYEIDATNIQASPVGDRQFDNVIAQSLSPQLRINLEMTDAVYRSVEKALVPGGRFIFTAALYPFWPDKAKIYYTFEKHLENIARHPGFRVVAAFRYQWMPTWMYRHWNKHLLHFIDYRLARFLCMRGVFVLERR
jgi:SAM-dependent methyltransferase